MNNKGEIKKNVKNWFLIQKVRIEKIIKEHKYISAIIGVFLISSIIALIVFASDDDIYAGKVRAERIGNITISSTADPETENTKEVKSFSTVVYDIPFKLILTDGDETVTSTRTVELTATLDSSVDALLTTFDDNVKVISNTENGKQILTLNYYANLNSLETISLYMKVYNIKDGTNISPDITICDSTSKEDDKCFTMSGDETNITVRSKEVSLVPKSVPGLPYDYESDTGETKRYIPFGILVGLNKNDINEDGSLTGIYINTDVTLSLAAISTTNGTTSEYIDQVNVEDFYGLYAGKTKGNAKMDFLSNTPFPYHSLSAAADSSSPAVYDSGNIEYSKCDIADSTCNLFDISENSNSNVYSLKITGVKTDGRYVIYNSTGTADVFADVFNKFKEIVNLLNILFGNASGSITESTYDYLALGTYYVTAVTDPLDFTSDEDQYRGFKLDIKYKNGDVVSDGLSYYGLDTKETNSTKKTSTSFLNEVGEELTDSYELAYGEEVILQVKSNYEYINVDKNSSHEYNLVGKVPVAAMTYDEGLEPFEMVEYSSDISEFPYYIEIDGTNENLESYDIKISYVACTDLSECDLKTAPDELTYSNYEDFKSAKEDTEVNGSTLYLSYVKYEISNLPNNADVDFRLRLIVGTNGYGKIITNVSNEFSYEEYGALKNSLSESADEIVVTPYKARLSLNVDGNGSDISVNLSNKTMSTIAIYPKVSLPANIINTNTVPLNKIDDLTIIVTLPAGINYAPNNSYLSPTLVEEDGKKLTYVIKDQNINAWIEPIYIDVNYSIDVSSNVEYVINASVEATSTRNDNDFKVSDISDLQDRTATAKVKFINTGILSYSMSTSNTTVLKEEEFDVITKIYNRSSSSQNNLELVTILPYNDDNNSSYHGTYTLEISDINSVQCTTSPSTILSDSNNLINEGAIVWEDCSVYSNEDYSGVTAIKTTNINLDSNQTYEQKFNIIPTENGVSDYYKFKSYIKTEDNIAKEINAIIISVETIKITGIVWEDFDNDGLISADESRIPDIELKLYDSNTDEIIQTVYSDKKGIYTFDQIYTEDSVVSGSYYIVANYNTTKYSLTYHNVGNDKSINSSFCSTKGTTCSVNNEDIYDGEIFDDIEDGTLDEDLEGDESYDNLEEIETEEPPMIIRTEEIVINESTHTVSNVNLGLSPKKLFSINLNKYITNTTVTNTLGFADTKTFGNVSFAKLDVKDINNVSIKVTYTIEVENKGYYPGYVYKIKDIIPDGMSFNSSYIENSDWTLNEAGYLENSSLSNSVLNPNERKYITLSLDLVRKEAGSFINYAIVDDSDLEIYNGTASELKNGGI